MSQRFPEQLLAAAKLLLAAGNLRAIRSVLIEHQHLLLTDDGETILDALRKDARERQDDDTAERIEVLAAMLSHARSLGIDQAFAEIKREFVARPAVVDLVRASSIAELANTLRWSAEILLADEATGLLQSFLATAESSDLKVIIRHRLSVLERARRNGISRAIEWEEHAYLFRRTLGARSEQETEELVASRLDMFASELMGEVFQQLLDQHRGNDPTIRKFYYLRALILQVLRARADDIGYLSPAWLRPGNATRKFAEIVRRNPSLEEVQREIAADPSLLSALADIEGALDGKPGAVDHDVLPSTSSLQSMLDRTLLNSYSAPDAERLALQVTGSIAPPDGASSPDYDDWLALVEPWFADLDISSSYHDLTRTLSADRFSLSREIARISKQLETQSRTTNPLACAGLHRQLALLHLVLPIDERAAAISAAIRHCETALGLLTKKSAPLAWANTQALLGELWLARLGGGSPGAVERKLRAIEEKLLGRIEHDLRDFSARYDSADRAVGRFDFALEVHKRPVAPTAWAAALVGLATALVLRWRGDAEVNRAEALRHFKSALSVLEAERGSPVWATAHARFAYCNRWLAAVPTKQERESAAHALSCWQGRSYALRRRSVLENQAMRAFGAGDWGAARDAIVAAIDTVQELAADADSLHARSSGLARASYLQTLAAYCLIRQDRFDKAILDFERSARLFDPETVESADALLRSIPSDVIVAAPLVTEHGTAVFMLRGGQCEVAPSDVLLLEGLNDETLGNLLVSERKGSEFTAKGWLHRASEWRERPHDPTAFAETTSAWTSILEKIWTMLVGPVVSRLPDDGSTLVWILQRGLGMLPLHAAWTRSGEARTYLIDRFPVAYAPSIGLLKGPLRRGGDSATASVLTIHPASNYPLAFAEQECSAVGREFPHHVHLTGQDASHDGVLSRLAEHPYVHFACHGEADWNDILNSRLEMSDEDLRLHEIQDRARLHDTRLVVLSACETGLTDFRHLPSANLGMDSVLRNAGAGCVISSLWPVWDAATFLLMKKFYEYHRREALVPSVALARAQRWLRLLNHDEVRSELRELPDAAVPETERPFEDLYYWAAFRLTGV